MNILNSSIVIYKEFPIKPSFVQVAVGVPRNGFPARRQAAGDPIMLLSPGAVGSNGS